MAMIRSSVSPIRSSRRSTCCLSVATSPRCSVTCARSALLRALELGEQFVLDRAGARELFAKYVHLPRSFGDFGRDRLARREKLDVALLLLDDRRFAELGVVEPVLGRGDLALERGDVRDER